MLLRGIATKTLQLQKNASTYCASDSDLLQEKLNHAAFLPTSAVGKNRFRICGYRKGKRSKLTDHLNYTVMLGDNHLNLNDGIGTFEVKKC